MRSRLEILATRAVPLTVGTLAAVVLAFTASVYAVTYTNGGITLTVPDYSLSSPLNHCEPQNDATANTISLGGIPNGSTVVLSWIISSGVAGDPITTVTQSFTNQGGTVHYGVPYPEDTSTWPGQNGASRSIVVAVAAMVANAQTGTKVKIVAKSWKVVCVPDSPEGFEGCTPGYWRQVGEPYANSDQHLHSWLDTPYLPADDFEVVFGVNASFDPHALGDAVWLNGGGENAMARHAVAALLNAASPDVTYPMTVGEVIAAVQNAYATGNFSTAHHLFEGYNEAMDEEGNHLCPLN